MIFGNQSRTQKKLEEFINLDFFSNVGRPVESCLNVNSWKEAIASCEGEIWSSVQLQVKNRYARELRQHNFQRGSEWNQIASSIRPQVNQIISDKINPVAKELSLSSGFRNAVAWDLLMISLEVEFLDAISPSFFLLRIDSIYQAGHFPCGWEGPKLEEGWGGDLSVWRLRIY